MKAKSPRKSINADEKSQKADEKQKGDENSQIIHTNVSFEGKTLLEIEVKSKKLEHEEAVEKFKCSLCDAEYTFEGNLKKHIKSVHDENKPFKCVQCPSKFAMLSGLNRHFEAVHEKKRPFQCTHCERCFYEKNKLKKHMESVHDIYLETIDKQVWQYGLWSFLVVGTTLERFLPKNQHT